MLKLKEDGPSNEALNQLFAWKKDLEKSNLKDNKVLDLDESDDPINILRTNLLEYAEKSLTLMELYENQGISSEKDSDIIISLNVESKNAQNLNQSARFSVPNPLENKLNKAQEVVTSVTFGTAAVEHVMEEDTTTRSIQTSEFGSGLNDNQSFHIEYTAETSISSNKKSDAGLDYNYDPSYNSDTETTMKSNPISEPGSDYNDGPNSESEDYAKTTISSKQTSELGSEDLAETTLSSEKTIKSGLDNNKSGGIGTGLNGMISLLAIAIQQAKSGSIYSTEDNLVSSTSESQTGYLGSEDSSKSTISTIEINELVYDKSNETSYGTVDYTKTTTSNSKTTEPGSDYNDDPSDETEDNAESTESSSQANELSSENLAETTTNINQTNNQPGSNNIESHGISTGLDSMINLLAMAVKQAKSASSDAKEGFPKSERVMQEPNIHQLTENHSSNKNTKVHKGHNPNVVAVFDDGVDDPSVIKVGNQSNENLGPEISTKKGDLLSYFPINIGETDEKTINGNYNDDNYDRKEKYTNINNSTETKSSDKERKEKLAENENLKNVYYDDGTKNDDESTQIYFNYENLEKGLHANNSETKNLTDLENVEKKSANLVLKNTHKIQQNKKKDENIFKKSDADSISGNDYSLFNTKHDGKLGREEENNHLDAGKDYNYDTEGEEKSHQSDYDNNGVTDYKEDTTKHDNNSNQGVTERDAEYDGKSEGVSESKDEDHYNDSNDISDYNEDTTKHEIKSNQIDDSSDVEYGAKIEEVTEHNDESADSEDKKETLTLAKPDEYYMELANQVPNNNNGNDYNDKNTGHDYSFVDIKAKEQNEKQNLPLPLEEKEYDYKNSVKWYGDYGTDLSNENSVINSEMNEKNFAIKKPETQDDPNLPHPPEKKEYEYKKDAKWDRDSKTDLGNENPVIIQKMNE